MILQVVEDPVELKRAKIYKQLRQLENGFNPERSKKIVTELFEHCRVRYYSIKPMLYCLAEFEF